MAHTPEPWLICEDEVSVYQPDLDTLISTYGDAVMDGRTHEQQVDDAKVISRAPEMLRFLRRIVNEKELPDNGKAMPLKDRTAVIPYELYREILYFIDHAPKSPPPTS